MSQAGQAKAIEKAKKKKVLVADGGPHEWEFWENGAFLAVSGASRERTDEITAGIYQGHVSIQGPMLVPMKIITDTLLDLPNRHVKSIIHSVQNFWTRRAKYELYGQIFKRGILVHGGAGSGKTVTITLLSQELVAADGIVLYFNDPGTAVRVLQAVRVREPGRAIIAIFEDLDDQIANYGEHNFLSLLDGETKVDNIVYLATTNYLSKLPLRIRARPSRFDEVVEIPMPERDTREAYLRHLLAIEERSVETHEVEVQDWADRTEGLSIAHLKELVIAVKVLDNPFEQSLTRLKELGTILNSEEEG